MLRRRLTSIIVTATLLILFSNQPASPKENNVIVGGFPKRGLDDPSINLLQDNFRLFSEYVSRKIGRQIVLKPVKDINELNQMLKAKELDFTWGWTPLESARALNSYPLVPFVRADPINDGKERIGFKYLLITRADNPYLTLDDLKGKTLLYLDSEDGIFKNLSLLFVEIFLKKNGKDVGKFFNMVPTQKDLSLQTPSLSMEYGQSKDFILKVLSDPNIAASVREEAYILMIKRNPKIEQMIRVVASSEPLNIMPFFVWGDSDPELKNRIKTTLLGMHKNPEGEEILRSVRIGAWRDAAGEGFSSLTKLLGEARQLNIEPGL